MFGKVFRLLLSFLFISSFSPRSPGGPGIRSILLEYTRADQTFNSANTSPAKDSACIEGFKSVISQLKPLSGTRTIDSLLYQSAYKLGVLYEMYRNYSLATSSYLLAMNFSKGAAEIFKINELAGAGYYNLNNFDSATYFLH